MIGATGPYLELLIWGLFSILGVPIIGTRLISKIDSTENWLKKYKLAKLTLTFVSLVIISHSLNLLLLTTTDSYYVLFLPLATFIAILVFVVKKEIIKNSI